MEEIWKDIKGYEGLYRISNYGKVFSLISKRELKIANHTDSKGNKTLRVTLHQPTKNFLLHRLVYQNFVGEIRGMLELKDGDYTNCKVYNLSDVKQSLKYKYKRCVRILDTETMELHYSYKSISDKLNVSDTAVKLALKRKSKKYSRYKLII